MSKPGDTGFGFIYAFPQGRCMVYLLVYLPDFSGKSWRITMEPKEDEKPKDHQGPMGAWIRLLKESDRKRFVTFQPWLHLGVPGKKR